MYPLFTGPLTTERVAVPIRQLPEHLQGVKLVQLSDFHFDGKRLSPRLLNAAIDQVNRLEPDLVALTGDYVTREISPIFELCSHLQRLRSKHGIVAVLGNHDNVSVGGRRTILRELKRTGIMPLWNQVITPLGPEFPVIGLAEKWSREFNPGKVLEQVPASIPRLVLVHNPDSAAILAHWRIDLQLSGHTHGGQIVLPQVGPLAKWNPKLPANRLIRTLIPVPYLKQECLHVVQHWEWASGLHRVGANWLYVNRGLGTYAPGRLRCPPEVTEITLTRA
jgi:predicted MPP superfamily phosphohydrolase